MSDKPDDNCPGCLGARVQVRQSDGLKVICPCCEGSGRFSLKGIMTGMPVPMPAPNVPFPFGSVVPIGTDKPHCIVRGTRE